jgi:hypothetical protein
MCPLQSDSSSGCVPVVMGKSCHVDPHACGHGSITLHGPMDMRAYWKSQDHFQSAPLFLWNTPFTSTAPESRKSHTTCIHTCFCLARRSSQKFMVRTRQDVLDDIGRGGCGDGGRRTSNQLLIPSQRTERCRMEFEDKNEPSLGPLFEERKVDRCGSLGRAVRTGGARGKVDGGEVARDDSKRSGDR